MADEWETISPDTSGQVTTPSDTDEWETVEEAAPIIADEQISVGAGSDLDVRSAPEQTDDPSFATRVGGALTKGFMGVSEALIDLPKHIVGQAKLPILDRLAAEVLAAKDPKIRAAKLQDMAKVEKFFSVVRKDLGRAGELHRKGQEVILKNHPEWESEPPESFVDLLSSPDKLVVSLAESAPLLLAAGIMTAAGQPQIATMMMFSSEGQEASHRAKAAGESDDVANQAYLVYGTVSAALESMQLKGLMKIGKGVYNSILNRTAQKVARRGAKSLTWEVIKMAAKESAEEVAQGEWGDVTANILYDEEFGPLGAHIDRRAQEAYIGFTMGLVPGGGGAIVGKAKQKQMVNKFTGKNSPLKTQQYAILTAENPGNQPLSAEENAARNTALIADLEAMGVTPIPVEGRYGGPVENSFMVFGLTNEQALELGKKHGQESVLTPQGLVYQDGTVNPADLDKINFKADQTEYYSEVDIAGKKVKFSIPIDFDTKVGAEAPAEPAVQQPSVEAETPASEAAPAEPATIDATKEISQDEALADIQQWLDAAYRNDDIETFNTILENEFASLPASKAKNILQGHAEVLQMHMEERYTTTETADEAIGKQYGLNPVETNERLGKAELQYRELKNKPVSERTRSEQKELAFLKHNRTDIEAILERDTKPIEKKMSKKEALALGHSIPESLGWTEEQRRDFNKKITNQSSMKNMTPAQRKQVVTALVQEARKAGEEVSGPDTSPMDELLTKLAERQQKPALTQRDRRNMKKLRKIYYTMKSGTSFYFLHMSRMKRLCRSMDNYQTDGPFMKYVYQPVKDADTKAAVNFSAVMDAALRAFEDLDIDVPTMFSEVKDIGIKDKLSTAERIGVWALAQNEKTKNHLSSEFTAEEIDAIAKSVEGNEKEMLVAAEIQTYFEIGWYQLERIAEAHGISNLVKEENYITAFVKNKNDVVDTEFMEGLLQEFTQSKHIPGEQHTIERKPGAKRNLELNVFMIHARAARSIERFKAMAPVADKVGQMLKHKGLKSDLNDATYGHGSRLFDKWLQDSIRGQSAYESSAIGSALRWLRTRSVHFVLGAKITTAAKQGISLLPAMGVHPGMAPLILANLAHVPFGSKFKAMHAEINAKSEMMRHRDWDRDLRQTYDQKSVKKLYAGKKLSPILMRMATWVDRHTAGAVWYSAYQLSQKHNMNEKDSVRFADGVVEDTQPMGKAVDLPAFFRGSELEKNFSIFQNQVNQNGNMLWYDTLGEAKARNISFKMLGYRLLMQQIIPALLLGVVSRGRLPEDPKEIGKDLAFYMMSPYFFVGRFLYNTFVARDWGPTSGFIWETPLTETYRFAGAAMKGDVGKSIKYGARAAGAWSGGYPPLQVVQTVEGGWNLATGETNDFRELIWSKYALKKNRKKEGKKEDGPAEGYYKF